MNRSFIAALALFVLSGMRAHAGPIVLPNNSFESPSTFYVSVLIDAWQEAPKPAAYVETNGFTWDQLAGLFLNTPTNSSDHIDNADGKQIAYLFAVKDVGIFQDYDSRDWNHTNSAPTHAFDATYKVGNGYRATVGVIGSGGGMRPGATMELSLFYRDAASNRVPVAVTPIIYQTNIFPNNTHLVDCQVDAPAVKVTDAWANKKIGIQLISTVSTNLEGGYWDVDNFRLMEFVAPALTNAVTTNGQLQFTLQSEAGRVIEILSTTNLAVPLTNWTVVATLTNTAGNSPFVATNNGTFFYQAHLLR